MSSSKRKLWEILHNEKATCENCRHILVRNPNIHSTNIYFFNGVECTKNYHSPELFPATLALVDNPICPKWEWKK